MAGRGIFKSVADGLKKSGKVVGGSAGLGVDSVKASADFTKQRTGKIFGGIKQSITGGTDPKLLNFKPLDKTKTLSPKTRRPADKYDIAAHRSGLFRDNSAGAAAKDMRRLGRAGTEAKDNFNVNGGWKTMAGGAGTGAIAGGLAGAGVNVVRGEDAWEGAKTGAILGAVGNGGVKGSRMAMGASKNQKFGNAFESFNKETGMTKSVKSLHTLAKGTRDGQKILHKNGMKI